MHTAMFLWFYFFQYSIVKEAVINYVGKLIINFKNLFGWKVKTNKYHNITIGYVFKSSQ
jgi:hypothetical protein